MATIPQMSLLLLYALLFLQSHLFLICVALTYNDSRIVPHKTCKIPKNSSLWMTLGFLVGSMNFIKALLGVLESFCPAWVGLYPLGCQILYHDCISMIVTRFTFFTENFVIRCDQVTKNNPLWARLYKHVFCKKPSLFLSSNRYRNLGPSESACRHYAYPNPVPLLLATPFVIHETGSVLILRCRVSPWLCWTTFIDQNFSKLLLPVRPVMQ